MADTYLENILNCSGVVVELCPLNYIKDGDKIIKNHPKKFKDNFVTLFSFGFRKKKERKKFAIWHDGLFLYEHGTETIRYGRIFKKDKQLITKKFLIGGGKDGVYFISYAIPIFLGKKVYLTFELILSKEGYDYITKRIGYNQMYIREVFNRALARNQRAVNIVNTILNKNPLINRFPLQEKDTSTNEINRLYGKKV